MVAHHSEAPARSKEHPPTPAPVVLSVGSFLVPVAAGLGCLLALLVLASFVEGDDHAAALFAAGAVLAGIAAAVGVVLVAFGSILWDIRLVRHDDAHQRQQLPRLLALGLIVWAGAVVVGLAVAAGLGEVQILGIALMITSSGMWVVGAVLLSIGSYRLRAPRLPRAPH